jgi:vacuolar-type H+-ATPase subunit E/Vma4
MSKVVRIYDQAREREAQFLDEHGEPNYHLLNLPEEALEELADAYNYLRAAASDPRYEKFSLLIDQILRKCIWLWNDVRNILEEVDSGSS